MRRMILALSLLASISAPCSAQVMLNQIDTFSSGLANWFNNANLVTLQMGGPSGPTDNFMRIATNGAANGPGSNLVGFNQSQWTGNYIGQGVAAIEMDLKNFNYPNSGLGMSIRIALRTGLGNSSTPAYVSDPISLLADGLWHHAVFPLNPANFTAYNSPPPFASVFGGGNMDFRIIHSVDPVPTGDSTLPIAAQLGVDNITAVPVPEPSALVLCAVGFTAIIGRSRRLRRVSK